MFAWIAGLGLRAVAGKALANGLSDVKAVGKWVGGLDAIHLLALALALVLVADHVALVMAHRHSAKVEAKLSTAIAAERKAQSELATSEANEAKLRGAIASQNASIAAVSKASADQQAAYASAQRASAGLVQAAGDTAAALRRSAAQPPPPGAPCEPSAALKEHWHD